MLWYVLERYVYCLLGKSHLRERNGTIHDNRENVKPNEHVHLTPQVIALLRIARLGRRWSDLNARLFLQELHGLKAIIKYVYTLPANKKNVPELISDPILLIKDVRTLIELHCHDNPDLSVTGRPVLPPQVSSLIIENKIITYVRRYSRALFGRRRSRENRTSAKKTNQK